MDRGHRYLSAGHKRGREINNGSIKKNTVSDKKGQAVWKKMGSVF